MVIVAADKTAKSIGQLILNIGIVLEKPPLSVKTDKNTLKKRANPAALGATERNAVIVVGEPS